MAGPVDDNATLDCLIVGAGPAGLTAATYLARFRRQILVVDAGQSRARWIPSSHNCPGFPFGVAGNDLLARFGVQASHYGAPMVSARITTLARDGDIFLASDGEQHWKARHIILATGVVDRLPQMHGVEEAIASGALRLCAICDGYEAKDQVIGVLAPYDVGIGHAEFLRTFSRRVIVLDTGENGEPSSELRERAIASQVQLRPRPVALSIVAGHCHAEFADGSHQRFDTLYPVLGADVQSTLARSLGATCGTDGGLVVDAHMQTEVADLYAVGDVVSGLNQISIAVGHAAIAASAIHRTLPNNYC